MQLYFIRHGQSEANVQRVISNHGWKHPLTELGRSQAQALAHRLQGEDITQLFSSPVMRAVQTAEILGAALGLPFTIREGLRENDNGSLEGRSDATAWDLYEHATTEWAHGFEMVRIADGENLVELRARFGALVQGLVTAYAGTSQRIALVGHGGLYRAGLPGVLKNVDNAFSWVHPVSNCGLVLAEERDGALWCTDWDGNQLDGNYGRII